MLRAKAVIKGYSPREFAQLVGVAPTYLWQAQQGNIQPARTGPLKGHYSRAKRSCVMALPTHPVWLGILPLWESPVDRATPKCRLRMAGFCVGKLGARSKTRLPVAGPRFFPDLLWPLTPDERPAPLSRLSFSPQHQISAAPARRANERPQGNNGSYPAKNAWRCPPNTWRDSRMPGHWARRGTGQCGVNGRGERQANAG